MGIVEQRRLRPTIHQGRAGDATIRGRHGPQRRRIALLVVLASSALTLVEAAPAAAATSIAGEPVMASDVVVGTVGPASVRIVNTSSDNSGDNIALETITLIPSCANLDLDCAGGAQPGVFSVGPMATGESLTACAGRSFTVTTVDPTTGKRAFTPTGGPVELGPPGSSISQCRINFDVSVVQVPSVDSNPGIPGVQTNSIFFARGTRGGLQPGSSSASGSGQTTVRAAPVLETTASPSALVGAQMQDTAVLSGGLSPTGSIAFTLFGPDDLACAGPPLFTSVAGVAGNGSYGSGGVTATRAGTYRWTARYSGDAANAGFSGFCNDPGEATVVQSKVVPVADFDGDGDTDLSVYRPGSSQWLVHGISDTVHGAATDVPVPGDYNGDRTTDLAVWRPGTGQWLVRGISDTVWGQSGDVPVAGDYNGDGSTDLAVWRPGTGQWLVRGISDTVWGQSGDVPVPGDYDGDARTDLGVWRPATGTWFVRGLFETQYGAPNDVPLPLPAALRQPQGLTP